MQESPTLADLPLLPRDETGPVFAEPWQAQAFAVVVELTEAGKISQKNGRSASLPCCAKPSHAASTTRGGVTTTTG